MNNCVCTYICMWSGCVCVCEDLRLTFGVFNYLPFVETGPPSFNWITLIWLWWLTQLPPASPAPKLQEWTTRARSILYGFWGSKRCPLVCKASCGLHWLLHHTSPMICIFFPAEDFVTKCFPLLCFCWSLFYKKTWSMLLPPPCPLCILMVLSMGCVNRCLTTCSAL